MGLIPVKDSAFYVVPRWQHVEYFIFYMIMDSFHLVINSVSGHKIKFYFLPYVTNKYVHNNSECLSILWMLGKERSWFHLRFQNLFFIILVVGI